MPLPELDDRGAPNWFFTQTGTVVPRLPPAPPPPPPPPPPDPLQLERERVAIEKRAKEAFASEVERRAKAAAVAPEEARRCDVRYNSTL